MNQESQLTTQNQPLATREPSTGELLAAVVSQGITPASVEVMERLCALREREEKRNAEREFAEAFLRLQQQLPTIQGTREIPDKSGKVKFRYANFDDIDLIVRPICLTNGFTYAFSERAIAEGRVTVVMTLTHVGGHSRDIPYSVRIGSGPPGTNESQADMGGHSYAQRGAIESGLALRIVGAKSESADARNIGGAITPEKAADLRLRAESLGATQAARMLRLALAGRDNGTWEEVGSANLAIVENMLKNLEKTAQQITPK